MQVYFLHQHVLATVVILDEGNPLPPTVLLMRHADTLSYTERKAPFHRTVRQGSGAKKAAVSGGEIEGENG